MTDPDDKIDLSASGTSHWRVLAHQDSQHGLGQEEEVESDSHAG